jgi:hypothetical protein
MAQAEGQQAYNLPRNGSPRPLFPLPHSDEVGSDILSLFKCSHMGDVIWIPDDGQNGRHLEDIPLEEAQRHSHMTMSAPTAWYPTRHQSQPEHSFVFNEGNPYDR